MRTRSGKQTPCRISFGYRKARLRRNRKVLYRMVQSYIRRWSIEETIRFVKQCYGLENVRVLTYQSLQNLMPIVPAATCFAAVVLDAGLKLRVMAATLLRTAKRIFGRGACISRTEHVGKHKVRLGPEPKQWVIPPLARICPFALLLVGPDHRRVHVHRGNVTESPFCDLSNEALVHFSKRRPFAASPDHPDTRRPRPLKAPYP